MATGSSSREDRRRKILERGSDRMALIFTGRSQSFSSAPPSINDISSPSLRIKRSSMGSYDDLASISNKNDDISSEALKTKLKAVQVMLEVTKREMEAAASASASVSHNKTAVEPPAFSSAIQNCSTGSEPSSKRRRLFSSKRLHSCIIESENTRSFCAFMIAVLVVLSYVGYPLFGSHIVKTESIIASRPLYILLLTDVTIIFARLLLSAGRDSEEAEEERKVYQEDNINSNWDGAVKLLERGLVVYQSIRGIFIDCSVYMVVVVCGLSQCPVGQRISSVAAEQFDW